MTNPSAQTMLAELLAFAESNSEHAKSRDDKATWAAHARKVRDVVAAVRAASAPAAVRERERIPFKIEDDATPEEASTAAGEAAAWPNGSNETVPRALRYLADHRRPPGGEEMFNSAHLFQLADEIEKMASRPLYAAPPAVQTDGVRETKALREFVGWIESWVSNPVGSYSVSALDGLFCTTRSKIAAISPSPQETA